MSSSTSKDNVFHSSLPVGKEHYLMCACNSDAAE